MPQLEVVSRSEAKFRTIGSARAKVLSEYIEFIGRLGSGQAGRLEAKEGETLRTIRRRLGDAGRFMGKNLVIKKDGQVIYFWLKKSSGRGKR